MAETGGTRLVLMRHGESEWSRQKRFAGWTDVALSERGYRQARRAGRALARRRFVFDACFTSCLRRAVETLRVVRQEMELGGEVPVHASWRLNERHYGALQERKRADALAEFGREAVFAWRRDYGGRPPALEDGDRRLAESSALYRDVDPELLPRTESHRDAVERMTPCWREEILPQLRQGKRLLVVTHTASLRGMVKWIEGIADADIPAFKIATAVPLVYELDAELKPVTKYYLAPGWPGRARLAIAAVRPNARLPWI